MLPANPGYPSVRALAVEVYGQNSMSRKPKSVTNCNTVIEFDALSIILIFTSSPTIDLAGKASVAIRVICVDLCHCSAPCSLDGWHHH